ncbi:hypothetical protein [uncultured Gimesia sp.]|uniref:hypothetical protein n=1 Tax=uncultured Gimesia sp. TaxID=1678688 RepID=UPI0030DA6F6E
MNWLNFFAADVGDGVGPFIATFLIGTAHWNEASIGVFLLASFMPETHPEKVKLLKLAVDRAD